MNKNRFYDQDPLVSQAVSLLLMLPGEIQTMAADCLSRIAEAEYRADELVRDAKTLGSDKILALYKSKQKKREYDKNPSIHRALNYLMLLTEQNRQLISYRIVGLISHLQAYLKSCRMFSILPTIEQMTEVCNTFLKLGPEETVRMIQTLETKSYRNARRQQPVQPTTSIPAQLESILEKNVGLNIRTTRLPKTNPNDL